MNTPHLWEIDHPYYGADGYRNDADDFTELRQIIDDSDEDMNLVYRWDWQDWPNSEYADETSREEFTVYLLMPRKSGFWSVTCPISKEQEAEVLEWLRGPRVLGHLRKVWEPLLGEEAS